MSQCRHDSYWLCDKTICPISAGNTQALTINTPGQPSLQCLAITKICHFVPSELKGHVRIAPCISNGHKPLFPILNKSIKTFFYFYIHNYLNTTLT